MDLYDMELEKVRDSLNASGREPRTFTFERKYLPPDPDGGGMFTVHYEITVTNTATGKSLKAIGGIGSDWVDYFQEQLEAGHFD